MIFDIDTTNTSFLEISYFLKQKGVKNNKFMLALYDSSLVGVNPFDNNLTPEEKAKIFYEISINFWYFLREVCMVPAQGTTNGIRFALNIGNCAASYCNIHNVNNILILPRQVGKTICEIAYSIWSSCFAASYSEESYLHKNQEGSTKNLSRFKEMKALLPKWLLDLITEREDKDNITEKYISRLHNKITAMPSASSDSNAEKIGRGSSTPIVYLDEFAFLERNDKIFNVLIPAWYKSATVAKKNKSPYVIRITTTPNNLSLAQAQYCFNYIQNAFHFSYSFYDIPEDEIEHYVEKNSGNNFVYIEYKWKELGLSEDWYNTQLRLMNNDILNAKRELDCIWPESSEGNVFTEAQLDGIKSYLKNEKFTLNINDYIIYFYEKIDFELNYIISCDVASGSSLDRSVITIIHPADFHLVGLFFNARIDTDSFKKLIHTLATQYLIHSIINIENNSYGKNILDYLMKDSIVEPRLYREEVKKYAEKTLTDGRVLKEKRKRIVYGTTTSKTSRNSMFSILMTIVDEEPNVFVSNYFYDEVRNLTRNGTKIEARLGFHDDIIMSYLITRYALIYGKCFQERFHINMLPSESNAKTSSVTAKAASSFLNIMAMSENDNSDSPFNDNYMLEVANEMKKKDAEQGFYTDYEDIDNISNLFSSWNNDY